MSYFATLINENFTQFNHSNNNISLHNQISNQFCVYLSLRIAINFNISHSPHAS